MGIFGDNEEKQAAKAQKLMEKYHLETMSGKYADQVREIATALSGNKLIELGAALQGNGPDAAKMGYLDAIVKQNFIMIKLLDDISKK